MTQIRPHAIAALTLITLAACSSGKPPENPRDFSGVWALAVPVARLVTADGKEPPLNDAGRKAYDERLAATRAGDRSWDTALKCQPPGEPRTFMEQAWPFQIAQTDERIYFLFQWNRSLRLIEMGLQLPEFDGPFFFGRSSGHWDGDTLVAEVIAIRDTVSLDETGLPHSEDLRLTERFRLLDQDTLEARLHFEDPAMYSAPWDAVLSFKRQAETAIGEDHCLDRVQRQNSYRPTL